MGAAGISSPDILRLLVEHRGDLRRPTIVGETPALLAAFCDRKDNLDLIYALDPQRAREDYDLLGAGALCTMVVQGHVALALALLHRYPGLAAEEPGVRSGYEIGAGALMWASCAKNSDERIVCE